MFGSLTEKFQTIFSKITGKSKLTEDNIADAVSEVRIALLEADVNYSVTKVLIKRIKEKVIGQEVLKSVSPGQQFIKVVHDELVALMGGEEDSLDLNGDKPVVLMLCGLQGSGKTTHCVKLANYLKKKGLSRKTMLAACDLQRPAAIEQLKVLAEQIDVPVHAPVGASDPCTVAKEALQRAVKEECDVLIVDTAGRLHVDDALMTELQVMKNQLHPTEILFVANASTGQEAVNIAAEFNQRMEITGSILTMLDSNTRGGAAISIREVTGKPLKFEGIGEKVDDLQLFHPTSMADRILGMGDTINLVRKAEEHISEKDAKDLEKKMRKAAFSYVDYLNQIQMVKKMGSFQSLMSMLPGMGKMKDLDLDESYLVKVEAMILSMTEEERNEFCPLIPSRRRRIANGSGMKLDDVNRLVKSFKQSKQFFKQMPKGNKLKKMMGGALWR